MNILIFDTETTTFPNKSLPATHPDQARIVQLAWILLDGELKETEHYGQLFKLGPETRISEGAQAAHKKTWEMCNEQGVDPREGMEQFFNKVDKINLITAHNFAFDVQLLSIENEIHTPHLVRNLFPRYCTMEAMTPICRLPARWKGSKFKWPKLEEAYRHCYGKDFEGAHDALADVRATADVFRWLVKEDHYKLPASIEEKKELCQPTT